MGLDMYMYRKLYVKNWEHTKPEERHSVLVKKNGKKRTDIDPKRITEVVEQIGYWRKANHIHNWIIRNVANGADDCREIYFPREKIQELLDICKRVKEASKLVKGKVTTGYVVTEAGIKQPTVEDGEVIEDPTVAQELLPTASGFFFGSTEYDDWYLDKVNYTIEVLETALAFPDDGDTTFCYEASW